ncbi:hypothetical protein LMG23994_05108 [Cupriavidus pinatubonensis]|uniref:Transmembrane protein n=1 Tax=Cupriavidus pinatubonensis TaxID=248026 RepID=A0ABM8XSI8_9BURK|nr:hypothetical protein LMG23994_05108 [Cupriavidus pinatubonensis]
MLKSLLDKARNRLTRFAESQENIDRLALRLGWTVAGLGALVSIVTLVALVTR